jgi:DNA-binding transcriptional LysR family regulator
MPRFEEMVRGEKFDPARSREVFRVAMSDHVSMIVLPSLLTSMRKAATHIKLEVSASGAETYEDVAAGGINSFLCAEEPPFPRVRSALYSRFCLSRKPCSVGSRSVAAWRKTARCTNSAFFVPAIFAIGQTDLILTVPRRLAKITAVWLAKMAILC